MAEDRQQVMIAINYPDPGRATEVVGVLLMPPGELKVCYETFCRNFQNHDFGRYMANRFFNALTFMGYSVLWGGDVRNDPDEERSVQEGDGEDYRLAEDAKKVVLWFEHG